MTSENDMFIGRLQKKKNLKHFNFMHFVKIFFGGFYISHNMNHIYDIKK